VLAAMLVAVPVASGSPGPDPLAHAPRFARAFGQQALAQPGGVAVDAAGHVWVADTGHGRVVESENKRSRKMKGEKEDRDEERRR